MFGLGGLLGIGSSLLGFGSASRGQRKARDQQLGLIQQQDEVLDQQLTAEQKAYRKSLLSGGSGMGTGDFSRDLLRQRQFTGF